MEPFFLSPECGRREVCPGFHLFVKNNGCFIDIEGMGYGIQKKNSALKWLILLPLLFALLSRGSPSVAEGACPDPAAFAALAKFSTTERGNPLKKITAQDARKAYLLATFKDGSPDYHGTNNFVRAVRDLPAE